jgi:hypothetical protein
VAHREEIRSANIPAITAEPSVSEKKLLMFMALKQASAARFYSSRGDTTAIYVVTAGGEWQGAKDPPRVIRL